MCPHPFILTLQQLSPPLSPTTTRPALQFRRVVGPPQRLFHFLKFSYHRKQSSGYQGEIAVVYFLKQVLDVCKCLINHWQATKRTRVNSLPQLRFIYLPQQTAEAEAASPTYTHGPALGFQEIKKHSLGVSFLEGCTVLCVGIFR